MATVNLNTPADIPKITISQIRSANSSAGHKSGSAAGGSHRCVLKSPAARRRSVSKPGFIVTSNLGSFRSRDMFLIPLIFLARGPLCSLILGVQSKKTCHARPPALPEALRASCISSPGAVLQLRTPTQPHQLRVHTALMQAAGRASCTRAGHQAALT